VSHRESVALDARTQLAVDWCGAVLGPHGPVVAVEWLDFGLSRTQAAGLRMADGARFVLKFAGHGDRRARFSAEVGMLRLFSKAKLPASRVLLANEEFCFLLLEYVGHCTLQERLEQVAPERRVQYLIRAAKLVARMEAVLNANGRSASGRRHARADANLLRRWGSRVRSETICDVFRVAGCDLRCGEAVRVLELVPRMLALVPDVHRYAGPVDACPGNILLDDDDAMHLVGFERAVPTWQEWRLLAIITELYTLAGAGMLPFPRVELAREFYDACERHVSVPTWLRQLDGHLFWWYWLERGLVLSHRVARENATRQDPETRHKATPSDGLRRMVKNYLAVGCFSRAAIVEEFQGLLRSLLQRWLREGEPEACAEDGGDLTERETVLTPSARDRGILGVRLDDSNPYEAVRDSAQCTQAETALMTPLARKRVLSAAHAGQSGSGRGPDTYGARRPGSSPSDPMPRHRASGVKMKSENSSGP